MRRQEEGTSPFPTRPATRRRKSAPAGALNITHGLGGRLVQSTSLAVISSNPSPMLLYCRSSHAFAIANRFRSGNNAWGSKRKSVLRGRSGVFNTAQRLRTAVLITRDKALRCHCASCRFGSAYFQEIRGGVKNQREWGWIWTDHGV